LNEQREQFPFAHLDGGKGRDRMGVAVGVDLRVELDGELEPVAHEGDVADDGLARHLQLLGELGAIGEGAPAQFLVDAKHALDGGAGKLGARVHAKELEGLSAWDKQCPTRERKVSA
jgi:hypothetical protein